MGKIQDAIRKVQKIRGAAPSSSLRSLAQTADDLEAMSQDQALPVAGDQPIEVRKWDYLGPDISIDLQNLIEVGLLDPDHARKHIASEYRNVKKSLLPANILDGTSEIRRSNLIMVASAERGEGKSFICVNLAMSLAADSGHSVVLVDADLNNPRLSELFGGGDKKGLVDLLADPSLDPTQIISPTNVPGLSVLPVGKNHVQAPDDLTSERVSKLFEKLSAADPNRVFVFDSSSVQSSTEALALAEHVGQILFVIQAGKTLQQSARQALRKLSTNRAISILMNQVID